MVLLARCGWCGEDFRSDGEALRRHACQMPADADGICPERPIIWRIEGQD